VKNRRLILASASKSRAGLMRAAGLEFEMIPAHVDEDAIKASLKAEGAAPSRNPGDRRRSDARV
jgi:septum formation protein